MNVASKRFKVWLDQNGAGYFARDANAPFHCHAIARVDAVALSDASLTERQFDKRAAELIYG